MKEKKKKIRLNLLYMEDVRRKFRIHTSSFTLQLSIISPAISGKWSKKACVAIPCVSLSRGEVGLNLVGDITSDTHNTHIDKKLQKLLNCNCHTERRRIIAFPAIVAA